MAKSRVNSILEQIKQLSEPQRQLLNRRLAIEEERQWQTEARKARAAAKARGIDQATIDRAIARSRYGE